MNKKLISLVLTAMAMAALAGCGGKKQPSSDSSEKGSEPESSETTPSESEESEEESESEPAPLPDEYDILNYWKGNMEEDYYTVTKNGDNTEITYQDVNGEDAPNFNWVFVSRSFAYEAEDIARFTEYKKFSFTGKLEKTSGTNIVMVKVEGAGGVFEKRFEFGAEVATYEFSTNFINDWTQVTQILFFVNRSTNEVGNGKITLSKMVLSKAEVNPDYDIAPGMPSVPQGYTLYNGGESVDVMYRWGYNAQGEIATEAVQGGYKFSWKEGEKGSYSFVSGWVKDGDAELSTSGLKALHFVVTGQAGTKVLFKFEDKGNGGNNVESGIVTLSGEQEEIKVDVTNVIKTGSGAYMCIIFPEPGATAFAADGELTMARCYLDQEELDKPNGHFSDIFLDKISFHSDSYVIEQAEGHVTTLEYHAGGAWDNVQFPIKIQDDVSWVNITDYTTVAVELVSDVDVKVMFKAFDNDDNNVNVELKAGEPQAVSYVLNHPELNDLTKNFIVFVDPGVADGTSATVTMTGFRLVRASTNFDVNGYARINKVNNARGQTVTTDANGDMNVAFSAAEAGWGTSMELLVSHVDLANAKHVSGTIVSDVDTRILLKPGNSNANEIFIDLEAGVPYALDTEFSESIDPLWGYFIILFAVPETTGLSGNIVFKNFYLSVEQGYTSPVGNYSGHATGIDSSNVFCVIALGREAAYVEVGSLLKTQVTYAYNLKTRVVTIDLGENGKIHGEYDPEQKALVKVGLDGAAAAMIQNNNAITLNSAAKFWDCNGTTEELRQDFARRYNSTWTLDENNADRIVSVDNGIAEKGMKVRAWTGGRYSFFLKNDLEPTAFKNIGFWVYNSGASNVKLDLFVYTGPSGENHMPSSTAYSGIGSVTAIAGQWTYLRMGFDKTIYNFQVLDNTNTGTALVYDNIALY